MKLCLSMLDEYTISPHFGQSSHFVLMDGLSGVISPHSASAQLCRGPCRCFLPEAADYSVVICRAIGHRVLIDYRRHGIEVFITSETDPSKAWLQWQESHLPAAQRSVCLKGRRKSSTSTAAPQ